MVSSMRVMVRYRGPRRDAPGSRIESILFTMYRYYLLMYILQVLILNIVVDFCIPPDD